MGLRIRTPKEIEQAAKDAERRAMPQPSADERKSAAKRAARRAREEDHPERKAAQRAVRKAVYKHPGDPASLTRPDSCERCGKTCKPHAHHADYAKPLDVEWLCPSCHRKHHTNLED